MKIFTGYNQTIINRIFIIILFCSFTLLFTGCEIENNETYNVEFHLDGLLIEKLEVKKGYKIPATNKTISAHAAEQGLYMKPRIWEEDNPDSQYNSVVVEQYMQLLTDYFWSVEGGKNDGNIWDFNDPVTEDLKLTVTNPVSTDLLPVKFIIAGKGKTYYDMAMKHVTGSVFNMGVYVFLLREDMGEPDNAVLGLYEREVNNVTFIPGAHLGIIGIGQERTIYGKGNGMFVLPRSVTWAGASLTLGNNVTVKGRVSENGLGLIRVGDAAVGPPGASGVSSRSIVFTMLPGSKVTGYTIRNNLGIDSSFGGGAAVSVEGISGSTNVLFQMKGGEITGNSNLWEDGMIGSGVTINNARMIMGGNAKITGNKGFGGDLAFGMSTGSSNFYLELGDNATIGEIFSFNNSTASPANNIRINTGWIGSIDKLNLGHGGTGSFTFNSWMSNAIVSNPSGTITGFLNNITLGDTFQWNNGNLVPDGLKDYMINSANGRLIAKP